MPRTTRIFISYSRDSEQHKDRLREFVERLRLEGLEVIYDDNWDNNDHTRENLKRSIHDADYVLCICTPSYKQEVKEPLGKKDWEKCIPVLFEGDWETSLPHWLIRKKGFDYTDENLEEAFFDFVSTLKSPEIMASSSLPPPQEHKNSATKSIDNEAPAGTTPRIGKVALKLKKALKISAITTFITILTFLTGKNLPELVALFQKQSVIEQLNEEVTIIWNNNPTKSEFIKQLINTATRKYNSGDYKSAGFYLERAIKEGDEGVIAKNNLAFMIRREEYFSEKYSLTSLLNPGINIGDTFSCINMALYKAKMNQWEIADSYFNGISPYAQDLGEAVKWWTNLAFENDPEGYLVLAFLARHQLIEYSFDIAAYLQKAASVYESVPSSMAKTN